MSGFVFFKLVGEIGEIQEDYKKTTTPISALLFFLQNMYEVDTPILSSYNPITFLFYP
ncbi:hypothetical protein [Bacillus nitratireducens]|uniref:hypothetical protein n=1 Tax=Bacillus nitratireducens TaxID=2026193 RepID=UPI002E788440|nr:hypothetical protein [Bacillus nitratireducens]